jgi:hypothetical protein
MMKLNISILCAAIAIALGGVFCSHAASSTPESENEYVLERFFFVSDNVVETFERDGMCYIVYDDMDAEWDNEVLRVDRETWESVEAAQSSKTGRMVGWLYLNEDYEYATYSYRKE